MIRKFFSLSILCLNYFYSQTHFTIPQNVWRVSIENKISGGKWKGHDGGDGWKDFTYQLDGIDYTITQEWKRNLLTQSYLIEYGFTDKSTFMLHIPKLQKFEQSHSWAISSDSLIIPMDQLLAHYNPKSKSNSGLGDVTLGMNLLLLGNPAWRGGKNKYSLYGGIDITFPFGERLKKYHAKDVDSEGIPNQYKQLPIGNGLTRWRIKAFGELYRKLWARHHLLTAILSIHQFHFYGFRKRVLIQFLVRLEMQCYMNRENKFMVRFRARWKYGHSACSSQLVWIGCLQGEINIFQVVIHGINGW